MANFKKRLSNIGNFFGQEKNKFLKFQIKKTFVIILALSASMVAHAEVQNEHSMREECSEFSQAGMRECLIKKADESEKLLRRIEAAVVLVLSAWDEDEKYVVLAKDKFKAANIAFRLYREKQCEFIPSLSGGAIGNALDMSRFACIAEQNNLRVEQLKKFIPPSLLGGVAP